MYEGKWALNGGSPLAGVTSRTTETFLGYRLYNTESIKLGADAAG